MLPPPCRAPNGYVGFAGTIQVNSVSAGRPIAGARRHVRVSASCSPASPAIINDVLNYTFGANQPAGTPWPLEHQRASARPATLNAPYAAPATLGGIASTMLASQAQESAATSTQADTEQAVQTTLASKLSAQSGVNMDTEMSHMIQLQNAYGANARVIATVQAMWTSSCRQCR